ncbi:MAG: universal stress protein [Halobacteriaceae archaeon]
MENILVAVDDTTENAHLIEAAIGQTQATGGQLVVVHVMPDRRYQAKQQAVAGAGLPAGSGFHYGITQARAAAEAIADRAARAAIGTRPIPYTAVGAVGAVGDQVAAVAATYDCRTVVLASEPTWLARRFGRTGRQLRRAFGGNVLRVGTPHVEAEGAALTEAEASS